MKKINGIYKLNKEEVDKVIKEAWNAFTGGSLDDQISVLKKLWGHSKSKGFVDDIMRETGYNTSETAIRDLATKGHGDRNRTIYVLCGYILLKYGQLTKANLLKVRQIGKPYPRIGKSIPHGFLNLVSEYVSYVQKEAIKNHDSQKDYLFRLVRWHENYQLKNTNIVVKDKPFDKSRFFTPEQFEFYKQKLAINTQNLEDRNRNGALYYMTGYMDAYEKQEGNDVFTFNFARNTYAEKLSVEQTMIEYPEIREKIEASLDDASFGEKAYLAESPPTAVILHVVVLDKSGTQFLGLQRSGNTDLERYVWTVGMYETMMQRHETIHKTITMGLKDELGLDEDDYTKPVFTFMGIVLPRMTVNIKVVVRLEIPNPLLKSKWYDAKDFKEAHALEWFPFNQETVYSLLEDRKNPKAILNQYLRNIGDKFGKDNSEWFFQAPTTLAHAWRMKDHISKG